MDSIIWLALGIVAFCTKSSQSAQKKRDSYLSMPETLFSTNTSTLSMNTTKSSNLFGYQVPVDASAYPKCNGVRFGTNLDRGSCFDVWQNIGLDRERISWGQRGISENFDVKLPYRWSSGRFLAASSSLQYIRTSLKESPLLQLYSLTGKLVT